MERGYVFFSADKRNLRKAASDSVAADTLLEESDASIIDNELFIRKAFESDPKFGCELLYRHYYQALCSHATRFVYSRSIAEDLVSDIFCQFYQKGTFKEISSSYRAFLYKSVRNKAYNYLRLEAKRSTELNQTYESNSDAACRQPDSVVQYEELRQQVETTIDSLPPQCRKIFLMHRFEDKKYAEIAEVLQLSTRTVEVQIRKASHFVKAALSRNWLFLAMLVNTIC